MGAIKEHGNQDLLLISNYNSITNLKSQKEQADQSLLLVQTSTWHPSSWLLKAMLRTKTRVRGQKGWKENPSWWCPY